MRYMKKTFNIILTFLLLSFSFYYTNVVSNYLKNKDPLMIKIKSQEFKYKKNPTNAIIKDNTIIPGVSGISINIDASYANMKKINNYSENLLVFNYLKPKISLENNKDKLIIQGNLKNKNISIILKINNLNILKQILEENKNTNLNFLFSNNFIQENAPFLENLTNNIVSETSTNNLTDYCYTFNFQKENTCKKPMIVPTMITHDYYYNTYQVLENGKILLYQLINENSLQELKILLSGIRNLNYNIVSLDNLLKE